MLRSLLIGILLLAVLILGIGFVLPDHAHVERSTVIQAPPAQVFGLVDGFRQFDKWSPWKDKDPNAKTTQSGALFGVGSKFEWSGNKNVGSGSQEIVASQPYSHVQFKLMFGGWDQPSTADFVLAPGEGGSTNLKWSLDSKLGANPIYHYFGLAMDRMTGPDFEKGLVKLKTVAESGSKTDFGALQAELVQTKAQGYAYLSGSTSTDPDAVAKAMTDAYAKIKAFIDAAGAKAVGPPIAITRRWDDEAKVYEFDAGIPVDKTDGSAPPPPPPPPPVKGKHAAAEPPAPPPAEVKFAQTYAGDALKVSYKGGSKTAAKTYEMIGAYKTAFALQDNGSSWEEYVSDPATTKEEDQVTNVYVPVK